MIKFLDLKAINKSYEPQLSSAVNRVIDSGWYLYGNELKSFEQEYAEFTGTKYCVGTANGLDALRLILKAYILLGEMKAGDEIIVPANTYIATILAITDNNLIPVLVEPDINTYNIDSNLIEDKITTRTKGIMLVHLYGKNAMNTEIQGLVDKYGLKLVEDNSQAHGCWYEGKRTGSLGDAAAHSFYPGKNLGGLSDAGAVTTNDLQLADLVRTLSNYGSTKKYIFDYQGINSRMDELQAAVLKVKLTRLDADNQYRRKIAQQYLGNIHHPEISLPSFDDRKPLSHVWHLFVIRHPKRDLLLDYLTKKEIETMIHYPIPPHQQKAYKGWGKLNLPVTEKIHNEVLSLPVSPVITEEEVSYITQILNNFRI